MRSVKLIKLKRGVKNWKRLPLRKGVNRCTSGKRIKMNTTDARAKHKKQCKDLLTLKLGSH